MRPVNEAEVRIALSQGKRCCRETLVREAGGPIYG
jgi:hypothetical protein